MNFFSRWIFTTYNYNKTKWFENFVIIFLVSDSYDSSSVRRGKKEGIFVVWESEQRRPSKGDICIGVVNHGLLVRGD